MSEFPSYCWLLAWPCRGMETKFGHLLTQRLCGEASPTSWDELLNINRDLCVAISCQRCMYHLKGQLTSQSDYQAVPARVEQVSLINVSFLTVSTAVDLSDGNHSGWGIRSPKPLNHKYLFCRFGSWHEISFPLSFDTIPFSLKWTALKDSFEHHCTTFLEYGFRSLGWSKAQRASPSFNSIRSLYMMLLMTHLGAVKQYSLLRKI